MFATIFSRHKASIFSGFILLTLITLYSNLLINDPLLSYDDRPLINAVASATSLNSYVSNVKNGIIPDLQPVRDLSYVFDIWLSQKFHFQPFHLTNLILWWLIVFLFYQLMKHETNHELAIALTFFFALSPVFASSVAWVAARKHLLSTLFILAATVVSVRKKNRICELKYFIGIYVLFLLSALSQPINVLWPIWLFLYTKKELKKFPMFLLMISMVLLIFANYKYYNSELFESISAFGKFNSEGVSPGTSLLAIGRYFLLCFIPFGALPTSHYQGSYENLVGLVLIAMVMGLFFIRFKRSKNDNLLPFLYFLLPLTVVTFKTTNVFCSDTYLLNASVGLYWFFGLLLTNSQYTKKISTLIILYAVCCGIYTHFYLKAFSSDRELWSYTFNKEENSQSAMVMALFSIKDKNFKQANEIINHMEKNWPDQPFISQLSTEAIFFNDALSITEKQEQIEKLSKLSPASHFYLALLYAKENKTAQLTRHLEQVFNNPALLKIEFWGKEERVGAIYSYTCQFFSIKGCLKLELIKKNLSKDQFNEKLYHEYLRKLNSDKSYNVELRVN
jgi:hypothetical protein